MVMTAFQKEILPLGAMKNSLICAGKFISRFIKNSVLKLYDVSFLM